MKMGDESLAVMGTSPSVTVVIILEAFPNVDTFPAGGDVLLAAMDDVCSPVIGEESVTVMGTSETNLLSSGP